MIRIREAVLVEGRYDMARLSSVVDAPIFQTNGFGVFKDKELTSMLRRLAEQRGIIILTDSDSAGFLIRNHISGVIPPHLVKHAYIPPIFGKERRKAAPSKEGLLGVEGMDGETLLESLRRAGATILSENEHSGIVDNSSDEPPLTTWDLYSAGLSGNTGSAGRRAALLSSLGFPPAMTSARLLTVLNACVSRSVFEKLVDEITKK